MTFSARSIAHGLEERNDMLLTYQEKKWRKQKVVSGMMGIIPSWVCLYTQRTVGWILTIATQAMSQQLDRHEKREE